MRKKSMKKNRSWFLYFKRHLLLFFLFILSFTVTTFVIRGTQIQPICANSLTCKSDLTQKIENNAVGIFEGRKVIPPKIALTDLSQTAVLGSSTVAGEKHIYVDLSTQTLYAYQGATQIFKTFISSGKWFPTPVGNFHIWEKLIATRMAGGEGASAYNLPNVPYVMYFYHDFGLHGAYWHDNFGHAMSHGCVNMRAVDAKTIFEWADGPTGNTPGTAVSVCDQIIGSNQCIQNNPVQ